MAESLTRRVLKPDDIVTIHFDGFVNLKVSEALPDGLPQVLVGQEPIGPEITVDSIAQAIKAQHHSVGDFLDDWSLSDEVEVTVSHYVNGVSQVAHVDFP